MRRNVTELQCARCARTEVIEEDKVIEPRHFQCVLGQIKVSYEDLCSPCYQTVKKAVEVIACTTSRKSRSKKKKDEPSFSQEVESRKKSITTLS